MVTFVWHTRHGDCDDCECPAAFYSMDAYGKGNHKPLCAVCAANEAANGGDIERIDTDEIDVDEALADAAHAYVEAAEGAA